MNFGLSAVLAQPGDELDLDLLGLASGSPVVTELLQDVGVQHQRLQVVAHRFDVDVLVDQLDGLGAERVPEQLAVCRWAA